MNNLKNRLKTIGLNENQALTYITLLKYGSATASQISKASGVTRTTVYDNLLILQKYNLISVTTSDEKTLFVAESPDVIKEIAQQNYNKTVDMIEDLQDIFNSESSKPTIKIYLPVQGFERMHELSLIGNRNLRTRFLGDINTLIQYKEKPFIANYIQNRIKCGVRNEVITLSNVLEMKDMYTYQKNRESLRKIKYIPNLDNMKTALFGFDDSVWILPTTKQGFVVMINNNEFASTFNTLFEAYWKIGLDVE